MHVDLNVATTKMRKIFSRKDFANLKSNKYSVYGNIIKTRVL